MESEAVVSSTFGTERYPTEASVNPAGGRFCTPDTMLPTQLMITIGCFDGFAAANWWVVSAENAGCTIVAAASKIRAMQVDCRIMSVLLQ